MNSDQQVCANVQEKLSAYLDDELTQQEQQRIYLHVQACPQCRALADDLTAMRSNLKSAVLCSVDERDLPKILHDQPARRFAFIGWALLIAAILLIGGIVSWQFIREVLNDTGIGRWLGIGVIAFYVGLFLLFLSVLRQRLIARKTDKYKKVQL